MTVLLPVLRSVLDDIGIRYEILVVTYPSDRVTNEAATRAGGRIVAQTERGYGGALLAGFAAARGDYILTMDADISHRPVFVRDLWASRQAAEVTIASRFVRGGRAHMPAGRYVLSRVLNAFLHWGLGLPIHDLSSGFRLYQADVVRAQPLAALDFDILPEILVRAHTAGWHVQEIPFEYAPRQYGSSNARIIQFGVAYLKTFFSLWKLRHSLLAEDQDWVPNDPVIGAQLGLPTGATIPLLRRMRVWLAPPATLRDHLLRVAARISWVWGQEGPRAAVLRAVGLLRTLLLKGVPPLPMAPAPYAYHAWIAHNEPGTTELARQREEASAFPYRPLVSLVLPVDDATSPLARQSIMSVLDQTYDSWELCLAAGPRPASGTAQALADCAHQDHRIRFLWSQHAPDAAPGDGDNVRQARGEFVTFLEPGVVLAAATLYEVVSLLNRAPAADVIYWDQDQLSEDGRARRKPWLKPDWSPELLLSTNYLAYAVYRRSLLEAAGVLDLGIEHVHAWDLAFRCTEMTTHIHHIPKVLAHVPPAAGSIGANRFTATGPRRQEVEAHLERTGIDKPQASWVEPGPRLRTVWTTSNSKVSIIIPTKDKVKFLRKCLTSLLRLTAYPNYEVLIVDNRSRKSQTLSYYAELRSETRIRVLDYPQTFNFSAANNLGARHASGSLLLFLNNDVEILEPDWLEELARWAERPQVGAVGAKLLFPDGTIQHAGVVMGMEGHSSHIFWGATEHHSGPFGSVEWYRNYMAVTGACLMLRREVFDRVGGFDEGYRLVFSDVELCLRIVSHGYRIVYTPFARLRHYEGRTRADHIPSWDIQRGYTDMESIVAAGDPYFNPNLSYAARMPMLARPGEESRVDRLRRLYLNSVTAPVPPAIQLEQR